MAGEPVGSSGATSRVTTTVSGGGAGSWTVSGATRSTIRLPQSRPSPPGQRPVETRNPFRLADVDCTLVAARFSIAGTPAIVRKLAAGELQ